MAIIIPSKNIYSKSFDPVVDNNIDKVEVNANNVKITGETENVYSQNFDGSFIKDNAQQDQDADKFVYYSGSFYHKLGTASVVYINIKPTYITKTIKVPESQYNKKILSVLGGIDNNGNPNITTYITGTIENGTVNGTIDMQISSESPSYSLLGYGIDINQHNETSKKNGSYDLSHENETYSITTNAQTQSGNRNLTASVILNNKDTIRNANFSRVQENGEWFFVCTLTCLSGLLVEKFAVKYNIDITINSNQTSFILNIPIAQNGTENSYELYTPQTINISANGETIKIDLENETTTIGDGNKVFSFDGNELIQTTNTPSIETRYQGVVNEWKNGKQTAVISCPIGDYYDENDKIAISTQKLQFKCTNKVIVSGRGVFYQFEQQSVLKFKVGDIVEFDNDMAINITNIEDNGVIGGNAVDNSQSLFVGSVYTVVNKKLPMTLQIGDIVIPYTYTNKGDKPLSYNKDFTPKQFKVVGTKLPTTQGVTQELTLLEV